MESTRTRVEVMKPVLIKAAIPLAISVAGFIIARITTRKSSVSKASQSEIQLNSSETISQGEFRDEESFHSLDSASSNCMEDEEHIVTDTHYMNSLTSLHIQDRHDLEEDRSFLRRRIEDLQKKELELERRFLRYQDLKEQESLLMELRNMLLLEIAHVESLDKEISLMEAESRRLEDLVIEYLKVLQQLEFSRMENRLLQRKVKKLMRKAKQRSRVINEQNLQIENRQAKILGNQRELEKRGNVIMEMEDEIRELQMNFNQLQKEKKALVTKLELAEQSASSISKKDAEGMTMEDYNQLANELEQLQKDRAAELEELVFLRWCNACLRHELTRKNQEQEQEQQGDEKNQMELDFGGSGEIDDFGLENELNGSVLEHGQAHPKKGKLIAKLKRWVEGGEKTKQKMDEKNKHQINCFGRHPVSDGAGEGHLSPRKSFSSA
ncbi:hypothetical protein F0562_016127 [Nyssa sinensis]|uniref:Protein CHUP1, chloroplastic n=1 Tax=Nyssa sinensis TaxID=561372 RepID=A0A5J4ZIQ0_9ASTE|nr:hypothetical protein F0562_016127 [Nyssa sinensis]